MAKKVEVIPSVAEALEVEVETSKKIVLCDACGNKISIKVIRMGVLNQTFVFRASQKGQPERLEVTFVRNVNYCPQCQANIVTYGPGELTSSK